MKRARRQRVQLVERPERQRRAPSRGGLGRTCAAAPAANGARGGVVDRLVQRRHRQRLPQQLDQPRRLPVPRSHSRTVWRSAGCRHRGHGGPARGRCASQHREPIAPAERVPAHHAGEQVQRRRQRRTREPRRASVAIDRRRWPGSAARRTLRLGRRCGEGTRTSRDSSRTGRAGRCRRARRSPDR